MKQPKRWILFSENSGTSSRAAEQALELWRGLFSGQWSMLDAFDSDGRRYLVAHENEPLVAKDRALTCREMQCMMAAALGQSDQTIAYSLGLSESTIRTNLRRGIAKLGAGSRAGLIEFAAVLLGIVDDQDKH